jgi:vacuolar-type H+-ATPase subunit D/Vma8
LQKRLQALHAEPRRGARGGGRAHGLHGLQVYPATDLCAASVPARVRSLMGVRLQEPRSTPVTRTPRLPSTPRPEGRRVPRAYSRLLALAAEVAAVSGNLERLSLEYRRSVRRARALQERHAARAPTTTIADIDGRLEEAEREDAIWMRQGALG